MEDVSPSPVQTPMTTLQSYPQNASLPSKISVEKSVDGHLMNSEKTNDDTYLDLGIPPQNGQSVKKFSAVSPAFDEEYDATVEDSEGESSVYYSDDASAAPDKDKEEEVPQDNSDISRQLWEFHLTCGRDSQATSVSNTESQDPVAANMAQEDIQTEEIARYPYKASEKSPVQELPQPHSNVGFPRPVRKRVPKDSLTTLSSDSVYSQSGDGITEVFTIKRQPVQVPFPSKDGKDGVQEIAEGSSAPLRSARSVRRTIKNSILGKMATTIVRKISRVSISGSNRSRCVKNTEE